jgi:drug/metabolite transporter (DMT)-like permease
MRWLPIVLVVVGNVAYHLGQKSVPRDAHPLAATLAMYLVAGLATLVAMPLAGVPPSRVSALPALHWSVVLVGVGIVGIEVGFLLAYRAGWPLSSAALLATTIFALVLLPIGVVAFREALTASRFVGFALCLAGLWLIQRPASATVRIP